MYHLRKCKSTKIVQSTDIASIDPDKFKVFGYSGSTEKEFLEFISQNNFDFEKLDVDTKKQMFKLLEYKNYIDTQVDEDSWFEIGYTHDNVFESQFNTVDKFDF